MELTYYPGTCTSSSCVFCCDCKYRQGMCKRWDELAEEQAKFLEEGQNETDSQAG